MSHESHLHFPPLLDVRFGCCPSSSIEMSSLSPSTRKFFFLTICLAMDLDMIRRAFCRHVCPLWSALSPSISTFLVPQCGWGTFFALRCCLQRDCQQFFCPRWPYFPHVTYLEKVCFYALTLLALFGGDATGLAFLGDCPFPGLLSLHPTQKQQFQGKHTHTPPTTSVA